MTMSILNTTRTYMSPNVGIHPTGNGVLRPPLPSGDTCR